jgi:hypothetical protein
MQRLEILLALSLIFCAFVMSGCQSAQSVNTKTAPISFIPPPEGICPSQIGDHKLSAEGATQSPNSTPDALTYNCRYSFKESTFDFTVSVSNRQKDVDGNPPRAKTLEEGQELLTEAGGAKVIADYSKDKIIVRIEGEGTSAHATLNNVPDANNLFKNAPYKALKANPPDPTSEISLPPPPFDKNQSVKNRTSAEEYEIVRLIKLNYDSDCSRYGSGDCVVEFHRLDPTTLRINVSDINKLADVTQKENAINRVKWALTDVLKKNGFRQIVVNKKLLKLN